MKWQNRDKKLNRRYRNKKQDRFFKERGTKDSEKKIHLSRLQKELRKAEQEEVYEDNSTD